MNKIIFPIGYYPDNEKAGPIALGKIYIGDPDTDPTVVGNQKSVTALQESGTTIGIAQPIRTTAGGTPTYEGSDTQLFTSGDYSMTVTTEDDVVVYTIPSGVISEEGTETITTGGDDIDVSGLKVLICNTTAAPITIDGFTGGLEDQFLYIVKTGDNLLTLTNEGGGSDQDIITESELDAVFEFKGGTTLYFDGTDWREVNKYLVTTDEIVAEAVTYAKLSDSATEADNVAKRTAKAWGNFGIAAEAAVLQDTFNIDSVVWSVTGAYEVFFDVDISDDEYMCVASGSTLSNTASQTDQVVSPVIQNTDSMFLTTTEDSTYTDFQNVNFVVFSS